MSRRKEKKSSLKERIDALTDALGRAEAPTPLYIRNELFSIRSSVKALEDGQALAEKESEIAALKAALEESNEKNLLLDVKVKEANYEIDRFREEEKKREKEDTNLPDVQLEILRRLPSQYGGLGLTVPQIRQEVNGRLDEIEIHVEMLEAAGLISWHMEADGEKFWRRSASGNKLVVAKRMAGEEEVAEKARKYPDLPEKQHKVLATLGSVPDGHLDEAIAKELGFTVPLTIHTLKLLKKAGMATDGGGDVAVGFADGTLWWIEERGEEYLAERDLL